MTRIGELSIILLIDNYDSFTYNLAQYTLGILQVQWFWKMMSKLFMKKQKAQMVWFSPGPGCGQLMLERWKTFRVILQARSRFLGFVWATKLAQKSCGNRGFWLKVTCMWNRNINFEAPSVLYQGIEEGRAVMRYHSILIEEMPQKTLVTARSTDDQAIMGIQHKNTYRFMA